MSGPDELPARSAGARGAGQWLRYGAIVLAVAAAATLALGADDARLLRLGIVAALWAALLGAFAAVRARRAATAGADHADDLRTIYQLELEREVAARREHELTVERELRSRVERESRAELDALRAELQTLRENLQHLLGGELLVERVAVQAQSTRVRSLPEQSQVRYLEPARDVDARDVDARDVDAQRSFESGRSFDTGRSFESGRSVGAAPSTPSTPSQPRRGPDARPRGAPRPAAQPAPPPAAEPAASRRAPSAPRRTEPAPGAAGPPLPRRDPAARDDPTRRRPRPEGQPPESPQRTRSVPGFADDPLFGDAPQQSSPSWTPSWESAPSPWDAEPAPGAPPGRHSGPLPRQTPTGPPTDWTSNGAASNGAGQNGSGGNGSPRPSVPASGGGRRRAPEEPEADTQRSVDEFMAAYRSRPAGGRRRRRDDF